MQEGRPEKKYCGIRRRDFAVALVGPVLVLALLMIYLVSPGQWVAGVEGEGDATLVLYDAQGEVFADAAKGFYLRHILEERYREYQVVEMITFGCSLLAGVLGLVAAGLVLRRVSKNDDPAGRGAGRGLMRYAAVVVLGMTALAAVFFAGEEVNWGQTFSRWGISEFDASQEPGGTYSANSIHNNVKGKLSVQSLGSAYLLVVLVAIPVLWSRRDRFGLPASLGPGVAVWPAATTTLFAYGVKVSKSFYRSVQGKEEVKLDAFYMGYLEQINEQKEMLLALALLIFLGYALAAALRGEDGASPPVAVNDGGPALVR